MRPLPLAAQAFLLVVLLLLPTTARAEPPDPGFSIAAGAATNLVGLIVGGTVMATGHGSDAVNNAGWITMMGAFTLSPVVAHGVEGEWARGLAFSSLPAATTGGTVVLFQAVPDTIDHGTLEQQRLMWALFGVGFLGSAAGVIDATLAPRRARARARHDVTLAPMIGASMVGLRIAGLL